MLVSLYILLNIVILSTITKAQQSLASSAATTISRPQPTINSPQLYPEAQQQAPPSKPPLVQLTRTTLTQSEFPSTPSFIPPSSIITVDVSQAPSISTQAPNQQQSQPTTIKPKEIEADEDHVTFSANQSPTLHNDNGNFSRIVEAPTTTTTLASNQSANVTKDITPSLSISFSSTTPIPFELSTLATIPTNRPQSARSQESRRLDLISTTPSSSSATVQFLKPKSKFKCTTTSDCLNGGMCFNGACFCQPGFTGESCSINIDECRQIEQPCFNNGSCVDEVNQFRCDCIPGFRGDRCQDIVDMCMHSPCSNNARCVNLRTDYTCDCEPGWEGRHCEKNIDECLKNPCKNNATCYDLVNDYKCDCGSSGFTGKNCDEDFDDCAVKPCGFGAKECIDLTGDFKCVCYDGFTGKRCDEDIEECRMNPCQNNGTCIEKSYNLDQFHNSSSDLTIYHEFKGQNITSNVNMSQYAGYTCECKEEYYGDRCEERKKCYTKSVSELCGNPHAECVNVGSSYECLINASSDGTGRNYASYKVDEGFKMTEIYVKYRSLTGGTILSFETAQNDSLSIDLYLNKTGLYLSGLPIKQQDEKINFEDLLDGTEREIRLQVHFITETIKTIWLARQSTPNEYYTPFKGCLMQVRLNNQLVPLVNYNPGINTNFELMKNRLEIGQCRTCFPSDCLNTGSCGSLDGSYDHCVCPETYTGTFCEIDVNECEKNFGICTNGAECENFDGGYRCNCKDGFRGDKCQEISDYCKAKQPCVTGTCKNVNPPQGTYQCECPSSHFGKKCDRKRDCLNECHNQHAQCINNITCACLPGRREERIMCEYVASCEQVEGELCLNGGTCKNHETGGYHCSCQEQFHGPICQFLVEKPQIDAILLVVVTCVGFLVAACAVVSVVIFRSVRKARATRGTYSPSTQEKFGNSASDLLKPPLPERLI